VLTRRRLLKAALVSIITTPLLASCRGGTVEPTPSEPAGTTSVPATPSAGQPKRGGKITMSLADGDVTNFDPIIPVDNMSIWTMLLIYDQLVRNAADGQSLEPGLAERWEISENGLNYTFTLRDAKFHDGSNVTAEDCVYSIDRAVHLKDSQWAWLFQAIDRLEAPDAKTVKIDLKKPWAPFLADLALFAASIIPKRQHQEKGQALFESPIGSGPFRFELWEKGNRVVLKRNDDYWDQGKPYLDELEFLVLTDANTRMLKFQAGELDIVTDVPFSQLDSLKTNPQYQVFTDGAARFDYVGMNNTRKPFDDKKVRQAINYVVNKDAIIKSVLFGNGEPANTMLPKMLYHNDTVKGYPYDVEKAKQLIAESSAANGFKAEFVIGAGDPVAQQYAQLIQNDLLQIGGEISIRQVEPGSYFDVLTSMNYDWYSGYYTTDIIDPDELVTFAMVSTGGTNAVWTGYKNPEVDQLALSAQSELNPEKRRELYYRIQELTTDDAPVILLYYPKGRAAAHKYVHGFRILPTGNYRLWEVWRE
jgi:peptide/nickel transport system substrate-binding protein